MVKFTPPAWSIRQNKKTRVHSKLLKIKKLRLKNFKSFKKAEIPFADGFTAIAGPNASGKCVTGDTLVMVGDGAFERIDALVEKALQNTGQKQFFEDGVAGFEDEKKTSVFALNTQTLKIETVPVNAFIKRNSPEKLVSIKTRSGREIVTTDYHPLFGTENGEIKVLQAKELSKRTFIATPRSLQVPPKNKLFTELFDLIEEKDKIYVPFNEKYIEIINNFKKEKNLTLNEAAEEFGVPKNAIKGVFSRQAVNAAHLIKILKQTGFTCESIADLIPKIKGKAGNNPVKSPWKNSKEFARLLGYYFAEGSIAGGNARFVNADQEIINDIKDICEKIFEKSPFIKKYKPNCFDVIIFSKPIGAIISKFCRESTAKTKKMESIFLKHADEEVAEFLNGYLSGDGYVSEFSINATTASKDLARDIFSMFLIIGITPTVWEKTKSIKKTGFKDKYFEVVIFGQESLKKFAEKINFVHKPKNEKLAKIIGAIKRAHSNVDVIPCLNDTVKKACVEQEIKYARKKNRNAKLSAYTSHACNPTRNGLQEVLQKEFSLVKQQSKNLFLLQRLAFSDIFWDEIIEVKEQKSSDKYVYDLSIDKHHNFIANNIFVHNSNIGDGLLFVFGTTSLKLVRASKLSDLINHDANEGYAKVEVELQDDDKKFTVSRMIDSRGVSIFRIDGKKKTLNEVSSLLLELGVKPSGHNFVVQGDITRVIEMNAKQRREIIDEVAGLSEFEEKKTEALKKLEQVETKVKDAYLVLNEREKYLAELEKEKLAAQKFSELKEFLAQSKATILRTEAKKIENEIIETKNRLEQAREELQRKQEDKNLLFGQEKETENKVEEVNQKIIDSSAKTFSTIGREIEETKAEIKIAQNSSKLFQESLSASLEKQKTIEAEKKELLEKLGEKKEQINLLKNQVLEEKNRLLAIESEIQKRSAKTSKHDAQKKELEKQVTEATRQENELKDKYFECRAASEKNNREKEHIEKSIEALSAELESLSKEIEKKTLAEKKMQELLKQNPSEELHEKEKEIETISVEIHFAMAKISELNESNARLTGLSSNCPTCQQAVDKKTIQDIFSKNTKKIVDTQTILEKKQQEKAEISMQKELLLQKNHELKEILAHQKVFALISQKEKQALQKAADLKEQLKAVNAQPLHEKYLKAKQDLDQKTREKQLLAQKLENISQSPQAAEFEALIGQFNSLGKQKNEKENRVNSLESEVTHGIEKRILAIENELKVLLKNVQSLREKIKENEKETEKKAEELEKKEAQMHKATAATKMLEEEKHRLATKAKNIEEKIKAIEEKISQKEKNANELNLEVSKNEIRLNDLSEELRQFDGVKTLANTNITELKKTIIETEKQVQELGAINMKALEKFDELKKEVVDMRAKADKLEEERKAVLSMIEKIDLKKLEIFMECFVHIGKKFSDIYFHFFGGEGKLSLSDPKNPLDTGLLIEAKYKENKLKNIDSMSGGEKSLTALAFVFAIQSFEPAPFYVFDEVDAALDKENSSKLARMIKDIGETSQVIAITHNDPLIKNSDQIIGVALNQQKSSVIGLKLKGQSEQAEAA